MHVTHTHTHARTRTHTHAHTHTHTHTHTPEHAHPSTAADAVAGQLAHHRHDGANRQELFSFLVALVAPTPACACVCGGVTAEKGGECDTGVLGCVSKARTRPHPPPHTRHARMLGAMRPAAHTHARDDLADGLHGRVPAAAALPLLIVLLGHLVWRVWRVCVCVCVCVFFVCVQARVCVSSTMPEARQHAPHPCIHGSTTQLTNTCLLACHLTATAQPPHSHHKHTQPHSPPSHCRALRETPPARA
jgi:hypothetical protein